MNIHEVLRGRSLPRLSSTFVLLETAADLLEAQGDLGYLPFIDSRDYVGIEGALAVAVGTPPQSLHDIQAKYSRAWVTHCGRDSSEQGLLQKAMVLLDGAAQARGYSSARTWSLSTPPVATVVAAMRRLGNR